VRVELGRSIIERSPSFIEFNGRRREVRISRGRWFDLPMSRQESLQAAAQQTNNIVVKFGQSISGGMTVVDSIKVYGKSKEAVGWSEDAEEMWSKTQSQQQSTSTTINVPTVAVGGGDTSVRACIHEVFLLACLEFLDRSMDGMAIVTVSRLFE